ncbi:MAG: Gfo/Idh/MocA family oxidoreductase [Patescibacteria group bacterium]
MRVGVIGIGGMGKRWTQVAAEHPESEVTVVCHPEKEKVEAFAEQYQCDATTTWEGVLDREDVDAVIVATPHVYLTQVAQAALSRGKHVFCEKPGGIFSIELQKGIDIASEKNLRYRVNFNIRLHPAVALAKQKVNEGMIGDIMFLRAVYGHGGREGYEHEWYCDKEISGGGELQDQGSHLLDIANWFLGPFTSQSTFLATGSMPIAPLEDNVFVLLKNARGQIAQLHASWTHWKKTFRLEIYGRKGYLIVDGLGGQYGLERLVFGPQTFGREAPKETVWEFPSEPGKPDAALKNSWVEFLESIRTGKDIGPSAKDAVAVSKLIEEGYGSQESAMMDVDKIKK